MEDTQKESKESQTFDGDDLRVDDTFPLEVVGEGQKENKCVF